MIGKKKPIAELVVAPKIVITCPILITAQLTTQQLSTMMSVHTRFSFLLNRFPLTSSIESFMGNVQKGEAKATTSKIPNKQM